MRQDMDVRGQWLGVAFSSVVALGLVVGGLWCWRNASALASALGAAEGPLMARAFRSAAVCSVAAAQVLLLVVVVDSVYRRDALSLMLKVSAILVFVVAAVAALALGFAA